ncbi:hypothetical protein H072_6932 [Dactylellina haptotyla CBS 200.50]|uniref:Ig-like domain-containing protein n=1 Tax=Dactylellina haptotyla (strain CBS 200.50) TaxID=1284197 RepID=S8A8Y0_DACHA|nr:hypothetical protein H072_6932 [Dactylellina haptotyla CBS 200.50]
MQLSKLLFAFALAPAIANAQLLFHGTSVMIKPLKGRNPSNATYETANFYCYFSIEHAQYISFGWFLGGNPEEIDRSKCRARPSSYDWWEYSTSADCDSDGKTCTVHAVNFRTEDITKPFIDDDYVVLQPFTLGDATSETLYVSYFDRPGGAHAVGSRRVIEPEDDDCWDAYRTIREVVRERKVPIGFNLTSPCRGRSRAAALSQMILK